MNLEVPPPEADAALARAVQMVGDKWVLAILGQALFRGATRFGEFQKALGIPTNVLARRLAAMTEAGIVERLPTPEHRSPHQYRLTPKGEDLRPVVSSLLRWSTDWPTDKITSDDSTALGRAFLQRGRLLPLSIWSHRRS